MDGGACSPIMRIFTRELAVILAVQGALIVTLFFLGTKYTAADQEFLVNAPNLQELQAGFPTFTLEQTNYQNLFLRLATLNGLVFSDIKKLFAAAYCESRWTQYDKNGQVFSGWAHPPDKGIFQINTAVHNLPWETPTDNILSAISLFLKRGISPWSQSNGCMSKWLK